MNLGPGWEKKVLIVLAAITLILIIYGFGSSKINTNNTTNQTIEQPSVAPEPATTSTDQSNSNNPTNTISNNTNNNTTVQVNATDQAVAD